MRKITAETPRTDFTIAGINFSVAEPFAEGDVLTAGEASALNQTFRENVRNNLAKQIKELAEGKAATDTTPEVPPATAEALQVVVDEYAGDYEFGVRTSAGPRMDPEEREARNIVTSNLRALLKAKGQSVKDFAEGEFEKLANAAYEQHKAAAHERAKVVLASRSLNLDAI